VSETGGQYFFAQCCILIQSCSLGKSCLKKDLIEQTSS